MNVATIEKKARTAFARAKNDGLLCPKQIIFGRDAINQLSGIVTSCQIDSKTALIVTGANSGRRSGLLDRILDLLNKAGIETLIREDVRAEPTVSLVNRLTEYAKVISPGMILGVGGGSAIDCAKAVAALAVNQGKVEDYLEGVGKGLVLDHDPLPMIAIPTTAGTGAEMTKNAVICSHEKQFKKSMRDERMIPTLALIDPKLTLTVPAQTTAAGGMDAITQLVECCISVKRTEATSTLAHIALKGTAEALERATKHPDDLAARTQLSFASSVSGICLANSGLAMAHGIAAALGALHQVPHGLACGILLTPTLEYNATDCREPLSRALVPILDDPKPTDNAIQAGLRRLTRLAREIGIPLDLKQYALNARDIKAISQNSMGSSMSGNPIPMTPEMIYKFIQSLS